MQQKLLAVLLLRANQLVTTDSLVDVLWPDLPPATARRQIQNGVGRLRHTLAQRGIKGDVLQTLPGGYVIRADEQQLDLLAFTAHVTHGRQAAVQERWADAVTRFREALALWRGPALAEVDSDLVRDEARRLEEQRLEVLEECLELELRLGRHHEVAGDLAAVVRLHPLRERLWGLLMLASYRAGRQSEALDAYQRARSVLVEELGVEPGPELQRFQQAILSGDDAALQLSEPAAVGRPAVPRPCQLPSDVADFTGRDRLLTELEVLLRGGTTGRAVVISAIAGMAGVGKTALAVHLAHRLRDRYPEGQLYVNLHGTVADRADPAEVLARFLRALGVPATAIPESMEERTELYRERLADRRVLVVLDNAMDEAQVRPLLPGVSGSAVLVTSRSRLGGLPGARLVELDVLETEQAIALLARIIGAERAAAEPQAAAELGRLCGHLPLALRIAGARLTTRPHWTLAQMAERLVDKRRRLDELAYGDLAVRAGLSLSYEDLGPRARWLLRRLGLLDVPDFASWVCAALLDTTVAEAEELIDQLVNAQLLGLSGRAADGLVRYRLHDLVQAYARERAEAEEPAADCDAAVTRAVGGWLAAAERAHNMIYGEGYKMLASAAPRWWREPAHLDRTVAEPREWLDAERLSLVAVVRQAARAGLDELCWVLAMAADKLLQAGQYVDDLREMHQLALEATRAAGNVRGEAAALLGLNTYYDLRCQWDRSAASCRTAHRLFLQVGEWHGVGLALCDLGCIEHRIHGRMDAALRYFQQALEFLRRAEADASEAFVLLNIGRVHSDLREPDAARRSLEESLSYSRVAGAANVHAQALYWLGDVHMRQNQPDRAAGIFREVREEVRRLGDARGELYALLGLGRAEARARRSESAEAALAEVLRLAQPDELVVALYARHALGAMHAEQGRHERAAVVLREAVAGFRELDVRLWEARALRELGKAQAALGDDIAARDSWARAHSLFREVESPEAEQVAALFQDPAVAAHAAVMAPGGQRVWPMTDL